MREGSDDPLLDRLRTNLTGIRARMDAARLRGCAAAGDVRLVVVTKSVPPALFPPLRAAGVEDIGENRVLAAAARRPGAPAGLRWHGIGHLQRNKAAAALRVFDTLHAVDSLRLARRLDALLAEPVTRPASPAAGSGRPYPIYLQVNAAGDPKKQGVRPQEALDLLRQIASLPRLGVLGFMTLGKLGVEDADVRSTFRTLREIRDEAVRLGLGAEPPAGLSMGMSNDFETAIEEGATLVRVGRAVFAGVSTEGRPAAADAVGSPPDPGEHS